MYLNCYPLGVKSSTPTLAPCLHEEPLKKKVQCGLVKIGVLTSGSLT
jgi:hypothetical protein